MLIRWTEKAQAELQAAHEYLSEENRTAAERQSAVVIQAIEQLANYPEMGRTGRVAGSRELVIHGTPLIVAYSIQRNIIYILAVLHGARRWPHRFKD